MLLKMDPLDEASLCCSSRRRWWPSGFAVLAAVGCNGTSSSRKRVHIHTQSYLIIVASVMLSSQSSGSRKISLFNTPHSTCKHLEFNISSPLRSISEQHRQNTDKCSARMQSWPFASLPATQRSSPKTLHMRHQHEEGQRRGRTT